MGLFGHHDNEDDTQMQDPQQPTEQPQDGDEGTPPAEDNQSVGGGTDLNEPGDVPPSAEPPDADESPTPASDEDEDEDEKPQNPVV